MIFTRYLASMVLFGAALCCFAGCTIDDISDELRVVELIPAPSGVAPAPHRLSRTLGLGEDTDRVERGEVTNVKIRIVSPDSASLTSFLRIDIYVRAGSERELLASATDFEEGETSRQPEVLYTGDIKPFLASDDFTLEWEIYYRQNASFPNAGLELETVIEFNIDVEIL